MTFSDAFTRGDFNFLKSTQEEVNAKRILNFWIPSMSVTEMSQICWYLFKTQMWVLLIRRYPKLPCLLFFVCGHTLHLHTRIQLNLTQQYHRSRVTVQTSPAVEIGNNGTPIYLKYHYTIYKSIFGKQRTQWNCHQHLACTLHMILPWLLSLAYSHLTPHNLCLNNVWWQKITMKCLNFHIRFQFLEHTILRLTLQAWCFKWVFKTVEVQTFH